MIVAVKAAWKEAGLLVSTAAEDDPRVHATVVPGEMERAFTVAIRALNGEGSRTCWERQPGGWSIYAFSETSSVCIDLSDGVRHRSSPWRAFHGSASPSIALLGPDGVGKSTALRLVRQWFEREAPFVDITLHQWRPDLLPSLASLAGKPEDPTGDNRPRRTPGKLHWLRLSYYYLDFLLGSWWKDRNRARSSNRPVSRMIVYDRCALDMTVDPVRFALKSRRGTRMLWRWTPRPQMRILLYDAAERIAHRKDDLQEHEVAEQLETWLKLAAEDEVHAIIRVNAGPDEIALRIRGLFIDAFVRHHEHDLAPSPSPFVSEPRAPASGYAVVPSLANPRFLIPLDSRAAAAASLQIYNAQRPIARLAKKALQVGLRLGIAQPFLDRGASTLARRVATHLDARRSEEGLVGVRKGANAASISACATTRLSIGLSFGTPGPNQKPALQIMNRQGRVLGYAKIGWNERTITSIRNEEAALRTLEAMHFSNAVVPRVLDAGWIDDQYLLVQSPVESSTAGPTAIDDRHVRFLVELHSQDVSTGPLPWPEEAAVRRMRRAGLHYYAHLLECVRNEHSYRRQVPLGPGHGDFTPWNIRSAGGKLLVFDWETFDSRMPAGWDLFHLLVAGEVEVRGTTPGAIYRAITQDGPARDCIESYFLGIGADPSLIQPLFVSYAAHSLGASVLDLGASASEKDRALQRTWAALLALACNCGAEPLVRAGSPEPASHYIQSGSHRRAEADEGVGCGPGRPPQDWAI